MPIPKGSASTWNASSATTPEVTSLGHPWTRASHPRSLAGAQGTWRGPEPGRSRWRRRSTTATSGMSTTPNWGLTSAASTPRSAGALAVAADQRRDAHEQHQRADGVGLAPQRRVVPGDRVEHVQRRGPEREPLRATGGPRPAQHEAVEQPAHGDVGEHRRQLDERSTMTAAGSLPPQRSVEEPDGPQDVAGSPGG